MFDREHIAAHDLDGRDVVVTIDRAVGGEIIGEKGRKDKKPILHFVGKTKTMVCNVTNGKTIATLYGPKVEDWKGKRITLYPSMTRAADGSGDVECIRIRPKIPSKPLPPPEKMAPLEVTMPVGPLPAPPPVPEGSWTPEPEKEPGSDG